MKSENSTDTLTIITTENKTVYLLGTAHISSESVNEVETLIQEKKPDHVCVEIDAGRYKVMKEGQSWKDLNIGNVLKQGKGFFMLANLALSSFQRRMGEHSGITPGQEMKIAIEAAEKAGIPFSLSDRDIQITLRRAWKKSSFWNKMKLLAALISSAFSREKLSQQEIEALKERSALQGMLEELAKELPTVKQVLIDERDRYLATNIYKAPGKTILAVIGAGHAEGIIATIAELEKGTLSDNLTELNHIPAPSRISKFIPWVVPAAVAVLLIIGFINAGWSQGIEMFFYWFAINGILSGIGAILSLAHPLTIVASILFAPFTSLNPTIGVGIVSGGIEAFLRKPRVADFENINEDILSIKGFFRNRVTHALLVFLFTSIGSAVGTFAAFPFLVSLLQ
ncbi:MAG: TraB/GumN family protein [Spirochaetales bacterium]|nr:TraB/GumN family protein [Spirochaetales bacterium]